MAIKLQPTVKPTVKLAPMRNATVEEIIKLVVTHGLPLGEKLSEVQIADELHRAGHGVSRTPVREAMTLLSAGAFVRQRAQVGCWILLVDLDELEDVMTLRAQTECLGVRKIARRKPELASVKNARDEVNRFDGSADDFLKKDAEFHAELMAACGLNTGSSSILVWGDKLRVFASTRPTLPEANILALAKEHDAILESVAASDAVTAERRIEDHLQGLTKTLQSTVSR